MLCKTSNQLYYSILVHQNWRQQLIIHVASIRCLSWLVQLLSQSFLFNICWPRFSLLQHIVKSYWGSWKYYILYERKRMKRDLELLSFGNYCVLLLSLYSYVNVKSILNKDTYFHVQQKKQNKLIIGNFGSTLHFSCWYCIWWHLYFSIREARPS